MKYCVKKNDDGTYRLTKKDKPEPMKKKGDKEVAMDALSERIKKK